MADIKKIGPSFFDELVAHGDLIGQHFTWFEDGTIEFFDDTPDQVIEGVKAVYEAHDPTKQAWSTMIDAARAALSESDVTLLRCVENGVSMPAEWIAYRRALRSIVSTTTGDASKPLPGKPAYPSGS